MSGFKVVQTGLGIDGSEVRVQPHSVTLTLTLRDTPPESTIAPLDDELSASPHGLSEMSETSLFSDMSFHLSGARSAAEAKRWPRLETRESARAKAGEGPGERGNGVAANSQEREASDHALDRSR